MSAVWTKAGRSLLTLLHELLPGTGYSVWIAAIEEEARGLMSSGLQGAIRAVRDNAVIPPEYEDYYLVRRSDFDRLVLSEGREPDATPQETP